MPNLKIRGLNASKDHKINVINMITGNLGIHITDRELKFAITLTVNNEMEGKETLKVSFFDHHLRDAVYALRMKLKDNDIFLSEHLTLKESSLAYEAHDYATHLKQPRTHCYT